MYSLNIWIVHVLSQHMDSTCTLLTYGQYMYSLNIQLVHVLSQHLDSSCTLLAYGQYMYFSAYSQYMYSLNLDSRCILQLYFLNRIVHMFYSCSLIIYSTCTRSTCGQYMYSIKADITCTISKRIVHVLHDAVIVKG